MSHIDALMQKNLCRLFELFLTLSGKVLTFAPFGTHGVYFLTSSLTKYVFYNWLINNILYLCVT